MPKLFWKSNRSDTPSEQLSQANEAASNGSQWIDRLTGVSGKRRSHSRGLTREGWYFLPAMIFILTSSALRDVNLMLLVGSTMIGLLVHNWRVASKALQGILVRMRIPSSVEAGETFCIDYELKNSGKYRTKRSLRIDDSIYLSADGPNSPKIPLGVYCQALRPGETKRLACSGKLNKRGRYILGSLRLASRFPFGLFQRAQQIDSPLELIVYPQTGQLTSQWFRIQEAALVGSKSTDRRPSVAEGDFYAMRAWRPGDSRRWIHWRTSARRDELLVRQFEQQRRQNVIIFLDLWQGAVNTNLSQKATEKAVSFAATILSDLCRNGSSKVSLAIAAKETKIVAGQCSVSLLHEALTALAVAETTNKKPPSGLMQEAIEQAPSDAILLSITTRDIHEKLMQTPDENVSEDGFATFSRKRSLSINTATSEVDRYATFNSMEN